jgi:hypothetical protein
VFEATRAPPDVHSSHSRHNKCDEAKESENCPWGDSYRECAYRPPGSWSHCCFATHCSSFERRPGVWTVWGLRNDPSVLLGILARGVDWGSTWAVPVCWRR